ncbi:hypothetical protein [Ferrimonas marina]|nr:hypothetical protein [Ferrimonas marina]
MSPNSRALDLLDSMPRFGQGESDSYLPPEIQVNQHCAKVSYTDQQDRSRTVSFSIRQYGKDEAVLRARAWLAQRRHDDQRTDPAINCKGADTYRTRPNHML